MKKIVPYVFCFLLFSINTFIYIQTENKINAYETRPPFPMIDFTKSSRIDSNSKVSNLFDNDTTSTWKKKRESSLWDLELELRLTHVLKNDIYIPRKYKKLKIISCNESNNGIVLAEFFLREAINVDKVLRLPEEKKISTTETEFSANTEIMIELPELKESKNYPDGIFILGTKLKFKNNNQEVCVRELNLE